MIAAFLLVVLLPAAESDPFYGWLHPPRDGSPAIDRAINAGLDDGLRAMRFHVTASCPVVAQEITRPLAATSAYFFIGSTQWWGVDHVPHSWTEYLDRFQRESTYRYALLLPFGRKVPFDPTVRVDDIFFGTDKIGHFFGNGRRYYAKFLQAREAGASVEAAERAAVLLGVEEEWGLLGLDTSGIFSFADIEANYQGLRWYRSLCEEKKLRVVDGKWVLTERLLLAQWVNPCWDEAFYPNAYAATEAEPIHRALAEMCTTWARPDFHARHARYLARGCHSRSKEIVDALVYEGKAPDPSAWSIDRVCRTK